MSTDIKSLAIQVEEGEAWRRTVHVTVPAERVHTERSKLARTFATRARIPGFRPGRIPASVIEKHYGAALDQQMVDQVVNAAYKEALETHSLKPISEGELEDLKYEREQDLSFRISFDVEPAVEIARVAGFKAERPAVSVGDDEVTKVLERLQDQNATFEPLEGGAAEPGNLVALTVVRLDEEGESEAQDYDLMLGQGDAIPDVEAAVLSLEVGGEGEFDVTFPDDFPTEERRGQTDRLRIRLRERKAKVLPELNDEFARSVGEFETLEALRERVLEDLKREADNEAEMSVRNQLLEAIVEANPFEVPSSMVDRYIDSMFGTAKQAPSEQLTQLKTQLRPEAERSVKRFLVIDRLAVAHGLKASDDDVDDQVQEMAERSGGNPGELYARLQKQGRLEQLEHEITERKVFDFIKEQSEITQAG